MVEADTLQLGDEGAPVGNDEEGRGDAQDQVEDEEGDPGEVVAEQDLHCDGRADDDGEVGPEEARDGRGLLLDPLPGRQDAHVPAREDALLLLIRRRAGPAEVVVEVQRGPAVLAPVPVLGHGGRGYGTEPPAPGSGSGVGVESGAMTTPTELPSPLRVAVIGSGPSGFYVVQSLLRDATFDIRVDLFDRLPSPYGLVRYGVAPDHLKIKNVTKVYAKIASDERVRFFGNVDFGRDVTIEDLRRHYHQIVYCTGAQTDRRLGIPGEDLAGSHPATEFVAWYNGHPDFRDCQFDFDCERAVVVGVGNVAVDVARILVRTQEELKHSDIAEHAMDALAGSRIREVVVLGRRGPLQAAFTNKELEELGRMEDADTVTALDEVTLDALSAADLAAEPDRQLSAKAELLQEYAEREPRKSRRVVLRFLVSPTALVDDGAGGVGRVEIVRNELYRSGDTSLRPRATDRTESLDAGLVFRSVGYRGVPLPGVSFREDWGTIPEAEGRVLAAPGGAVVEGEYCAGWVKRGPSGVIGTNRPDAQETVNAMLADARAGKTLAAEASGGEGIGAVLAERGVVYISFPEWQRIDDAEVARGEAGGRPRVKFTRRDEMMAAL